MEHQEQVKEQEHQLIQQKSTPNTNSGLSKESVPLQFKSNSFAPPLQRKENTNFNIAQLFANKNGSENTSIQMKSTKGSLPEAVQTKMESSMGADFSGVNIQTNSKSAQDVGALAYTQGSDVHFAPGQFKPDTKGGQELIGHELAHVIQQKAGRVKANKSVGNMPVNDNTSLEKEADVAGAKAAAGKPFSVVGSGGGIQMKKDPVQMKTKIKKTEDIDGYIEKRYKSHFYDPLVNSKELRAALGGSVRRLSSAWFKKTDNRLYREILKNTARKRYNEAIDQQQDNSNKGTAVYASAKNRAKADAYGESKDIVESEIQQLLHILAINKGSNYKENISQNAKVYYNNLVANRAKAKGDTIKNYIIDSFDNARKMVKAIALNDISQNRDPITSQNLIQGLNKNVEDQDYDTRAKASIKKQMDADSISKGLQMIGSLIDTAVPRIGTDASINIDLKVPVVETGIFTGSVIIHFGGEASKDANDDGKIEYESKAEMGVGASFEFAKILEFKGQVDWYVAAKANSIQDLMKLFSYGGFRQVRGAAPKLAGYLWGSGGKSGMSREDEAKIWALGVEEETIGTSDNQVEIGKKASAGVEFNAGIGKGEVGIGRSGGQLIDKDTINGNYLEEGKKVDVVEAGGALEIAFASLGLSGSSKTTTLGRGTPETEKEITLAIAIKSGYGNGASEKWYIDLINHALSATSPWIREFDHNTETKQEWDPSTGRAINVATQTVGDGLLALPTGAHEELGGLLTEKMGEAGENGVTGDMEDVFEANTSTVIEITWKSENGGKWKPEINIKSEKEKVLRLGILEASVTSGRKIASMSDEDNAGN